MTSEALFNIHTRIAGSFDASMVGRRALTAIDKTLPEAAAAVQEIARASIRNAPRKTVDQLTPRERKRYLFRLQHSARLGLPQPVLPFVHAKPGEPPRSPTGKLPRSILFAIDEQKQMAVIGPIKLTSSRGRNIPEELEATHPFMKPALRKASPTFVRLFEEIM